MMNCMGETMGVEMMIVMVLIGAVAALWKYLRSDKARDE